MQQQQDGVPAVRGGIVALRQGDSHRRVEDLNPLGPEPEVDRPELRMLPRRPVNRRETVRGAEGMCCLRSAESQQGTAAAPARRDRLETFNEAALDITVDTKLTPY